MKRYRLTENRLRNIIREAIKNSLNELDEPEGNYDDDDAFWERQHQEEMDYDMAMFTKAMQQANGTYSATSRDGQWKTGDKVSFKHDGNVINGTIVDFDNDFVTGEDVADIDYYNEEKGRIFTMIGVPLKYLSKMNESKLRNTIREAVKSVLKEEMSRQEIWQMVQSGHYSRIPQTSYAMSVIRGFLDNNQITSREYDRIMRSIGRGYRLGNGMDLH